MQKAGGVAKSHDLSSVNRTMKMIEFDSLLDDWREIWNEIIAPIIRAIHTIVTTIIY